MRKKLITAMLDVFGDDLRRVKHALAVLEHAEFMLASEPGDKLTVLAAAVLHDIGIHEAERKHNSSSGKWQEIEGPPIARGILEQLDVDAERIDHVCKIIANHHSARDINTPEFRMIWDADWLVNIPEEYPHHSVETRCAFIEKIFRTPTGRRRAMMLHVGLSEGAVA